MATNARIATAIQRRDAGWRLGRDLKFDDPQSGEQQPLLRFEEHLKKDIDCIDGASALVFFS